MYCYSCGAQISDEARFCPKCGNPIKDGAPADAKTPKDSENSHIKNVVINGGIRLIIAALYAGVFLLLFFGFKAEKSIVVHTLFNEKVCGYMSVQNFSDMLINGNKIFNPTAISIALGACTSVLMWAVPAFGLLALVSTFFKKPTVKPAVCFTIISLLAASVFALTVFLAELFVPFLPQVLAEEFNFIPSDVGATTYVKPIIFASIAFILTVASLITTIILNKRRSK